MNTRQPRRISWVVLISWMALVVLAVGLYSMWNSHIAWLRVGEHEYGVGIANAGVAAVTGPAGLFDWFQEMDEVEFSNRSIGAAQMGVLSNYGGGPEVAVRVERPFDTSGVIRFRIIPLWPLCLAFAVAGLWLQRVKSAQNPANTSRGEQMSGADAGKLRSTD